MPSSLFYLPLAFPLLYFLKNTSNQATKEGVNQSIDKSQMVPGHGIPINIASIRDIISMVCLFVCITIMLAIKV